ncbi:MAG: hypothetical protein H8D78_10325 [Chloroflexi bacterium]|nr:hypothetical protein [Chloroflexota bacterium]
MSLGDKVTRLLRWLLLLSVLLAACQPPFTPVAGRQPSDTVQSEPLAVSFWTPAGWEVRTREEQADGPLAVWLREPLTAQQRSQQGEALRLSVVQLSGYGSLADAVADLAPPYRRAPECQVEEDVTLQGHPAVRFTCPGERRLLVDVEGKLYDLGGQAPPRRQEELGPLWDAFLASVRFVASE